MKWFSALGYGILASWIYRWYIGDIEIIVKTAENDNSFWVYVFGTLAAYLLLTLFEKGKQQWLNKGQ